MRRLRLQPAWALILLLSFVSEVRAQDADAARRRRLPCMAVGGDLSEPAGILLFRRCLAQAPAGAAAQEMAPIVNPFARDPLVVTKTPVPLTKNCPEGLTQRAAAPDDGLCVSPAIGQRTLQENAAAASLNPPAANGSTGRCARS